MEREVAATATQLESMVLKRKDKDVVEEMAPKRKDKDVVEKMVPKRKVRVVVEEPDGWDIHKYGGLVRIFEVDEADVWDVQMTKGGEEESGSKTKGGPDGWDIEFGGLLRIVEVDEADDWDVEMTKGGEAESGSKTKGGEAESGSKTKGGEAESGSKTKGGEAESGSKTKGGEVESGSKIKGGEAESGLKEGSSTAKPSGGRKKKKKVTYRLSEHTRYVMEKNPIKYFDLAPYDVTFGPKLAKYIEWEKSMVKQFQTKGYAEYEREEEVTDDDEDLQSV